MSVAHRMMHKYSEPEFTVTLYAVAPSVSRRLTLDELFLDPMSA